MKKGILLLIVLFLGSVQIFSQDVELKVVSSVAPKYSPIARAVGASGVVELSVVIDREGNVISADYISGHPLLRTVSRDAIFKWKFEKLSSTNQSSTATIAVHFGDEKIKVIEKSEKEREEVSEVTSAGNFQFESRTVVKVPKLLVLIRPAHNCELHDNEKMETEVIPVTRSAKASLDNVIASETDTPDIDSASEEPYLDTKRKNFANSWSYYFGDDLNAATEKVEIRYCRFCRHNEELWRNGHKFIR
jgi:hypothetical protein